MKKVRNCLFADLCKLSPMLLTWTSLTSNTTLFRIQTENLMWKHDLSPFDQLTLPWPLTYHIDIQASQGQKLSSCQKILTTPLLASSSNKNDPVLGKICQRTGLFCHILISFFENVPKKVISTWKFPIPWKIDPGRNLYKHTVLSLLRAPPLIRAPSMVWGKSKLTKATITALKSLIIVRFSIRNHHWKAQKLSI